MKIIIFFLLNASPLLLFAQPDTIFTINGQLKNMKDTVQWVYLSYLKNEHRVNDSVAVKDNHYTFKGGLTEPAKGTLAAKYQSKDSLLNVTVPERDMISFFMETGDINIKSVDSFAHATVKGGKANKEFVKLQAQLNPYKEKEKPLEDKSDEAEKNNDTETLNKIEEELDVIDSTIYEDVYGAYARQNINSPIALYALQLYARYDFRNMSKVEPLFNQLPETLRNSNAGKTFKERMEIAKKTAPGMMAMDFTQPDTSGNAVTLSSFRGKYVLLNFWASWCPHCKKNNPYLVKAFNKYKDKSFAILSVSVDKQGQKEKWLKGIHDDNLTWTHVSDLKLWDNAVAKQYGITAIPQNFLIDPDGKIIARNLLKEKLDNKLAEIFAKE